MEIPLWTKSLQAITGETPSDSVVEDLELAWKAQKDYFVNYNPDAICFTEDPETLKSYVKQVQRWFSWRPSVRKHFREVRKGLKFTILWVVGESFGFPLYLGVIIARAHWQPSVATGFFDAGL